MDIENNFGLSSLYYNHHQLNYIYYYKLKKFITSILSIFYKIGKCPVQLIKLIYAWYNSIIFHGLHLTINLKDTTENLKIYSDKVENCIMQELISYSKTVVIYTIIVRL